MSRYAEAKSFCSLCSWEVALSQSSLPTITNPKCICLIYLYCNSFFIFIEATIWMVPTALFWTPENLFKTSTPFGVAQGGGKMRSCRSGVAVCSAPTAPPRDSARLHGRVGARTRELLLLSAPRIASDAWVSPCQGGRCTRLNSAQYRKPPLGGEVALPLQGWI